MPRVGQVLANLELGVRGRVLSVAGNKVTLKTGPKTTAVYILNSKWITAREAQRKVGEQSAANSQERFAEYVAGLKKSGPRVVKGFERFWREVVSIIGDRPGSSWEMRPSEWGWHPVIRILSKKPNSNNWVIFIRIWGDFDGDSLELVVENQHLSEKYADLFPKKNTYVGGSSSLVRIPYHRLGAVLPRYLEFIADSLHVSRNRR